MQLLDAALAAVARQLDLEERLWPSAPTREEQLRSLLVSWTAEGTAGALGFLKYRYARATRTETDCLRAGLLGGKFDDLRDQLAELPTDRLLPHLRRIVRRWEDADTTELRDSARAERFVRERGGCGPVVAAVIVALGRV